MSRIDRIFAALRQRRAKALMPFLTAGDPDLATTEALLPALQDAGASICEIGIPFSDPIADGPVIQDSMTWALSRGLRPRQVLDMVASIRPRLQIGLVAMVSYTIVHRLGGASFVRDAAQAGIDGFILPDLPVEESDTICACITEADLSCSFLIAPTTPIERARRIAGACSGFVYVLARSGITGEQSQLPAELPQRLAELRQATNLPIAVGFGIADAPQVAQVVRVADAAIVGSAIMRRIAPLRQAGTETLVREVGGFVRALAGGCAP
jgi:tryptophan synthase alpha chain